MEDNIHSLMLVFLDYSGLPVVHDLAKWSDKLYYLVRCKNETEVMDTFLDHIITHIHNKKILHL